MPSPGSGPPGRPLSLPVLPLPDGLSMRNGMRSATTDAWGQHVILIRMFGARGTGLDPLSLFELTLLLKSGSNRLGAGPLAAGMRPVPHPARVRPLNCVIQCRR